jgi:hypothetical protein
MTEIGDLTNFHFIFNDHLGTPILKMIGSDVVWQGEYEPYGVDRRKSRRAERIRRSRSRLR